MPASNPFRLTRLQGALLGSFFLHALLFYGLTRPGGNTQVSSAAQKTVMQVQLLPAEPQLVSAPQELAPQEPIPVSAQAPAQAPQPIAEAPKLPPTQTQTGTQVLPWTASEPKVKKFPELAYPPDTVNITATLEIEVSLDKEGKATDVKVLRESPKAMFTEWAWEMGMKGQYSPKITASGPIASTLVIRLDITPGMPIEVR